MRRTIVVFSILALAGIGLVAGLYYQALAGLDRKTIENHILLYRQLIDTQAGRLEAAADDLAEECRQWSAVLAGKGDLEKYLDQIADAAGDYPVHFIKTDGLFLDPSNRKTFLDGEPLTHFPGLYAAVGSIMVEGHGGFVDRIPWNRDPRGLIIVVPVGRGSRYRGILVREMPWAELEARFFQAAPGGTGSFYLAMEEKGDLVTPAGNVGEGVGRSIADAVSLSFPESRIVESGPSSHLVVTRPVAWQREKAGVTVVRIPIRVEIGLNPKTYLTLGVKTAGLVADMFPVALPTSEQLAAGLPELKSRLAFPIGDVEVVPISETGKDPFFLTVARTNRSESRLTERILPGSDQPVSVIEVVVPYHVASHSWAIGVIQPLDLLLGPAHQGMRQSLLVAFGVMAILLTMVGFLVMVQKAHYKRQVAEAEARSSLEEEVRRAKIQLQGIVDGVEDGILLVDRERRIQRVNLALGRRLGKVPADLVGMAIDRILPDWMIEPLGNVFQKHQPPSTLEGPWGDQTMEITCYPVTDRSGEIRQAVVVVRDITDRLRMQKRLGVAEKLAATSTLVAGVAHEIKNPLNSMALSLGNLSFLLDRLGDKASKTRGEEYLTRLKEDINRLTDLINRFMAVARPVAEERRAVKLATLTKKVADRFRGQAEKSGIAIKLELKRGLPSLSLESKETERAIENLALNAIEAMPNGGNLVFRTKKEGTEQVLEIEDNGPGISPEVADKMFDIFYTTKEGGSGLGLSIVHRAVEGQGGKIEVRSVPGQGTLFRIKFPIEGETKKGLSHG